MTEPTTAEGHRKSRPAPLRRTLQTRAAAAYLGVSVSLMRKWRSRGADDPGPRGPAFIRVSDQLVLYELAALDAWLEQHRTSPAVASDGALMPREPRLAHASKS